ncbi:hypothetical protein COW36_09405 [bacterium (Candidatus Blackallbacteria) CG17_big_fil_post_rev_8_21_14_2_50_48_46]|uniref:Uncharacterized protein n=1 Tax=bacterium (Candidatus Blackallbacteria) CG17_big_fil_post_rev_8_21_14_2_50_48_46 TaxID=2014261 RepID=A0A2M7G6M2_9BACT|nr:MAG: hypothetical protein COW64_06255 [bacterium (Candidatus Blackallbacteria) CG18_big_fil_WC_8_21_14_2_50_49_26]PIW17278.1 MAG: hypothetical protein COW36_09405 [bacterium (Candidatus Blackallbacteria) CG17_big_fil_post_rev_8_21_14_2_50_48_46]
MNQLSEEELLTISEPVFQVLPIEKIRTIVFRAYEGVRDKHDPDFGFDQITFGTDIFRVLTNKFREFVEKKEIEHVYQKNDLRIIIPDNNFEVAFRRVRNTTSATDNIFSCFPNTAFCTRSLQNTDPNQLYLPFEEKEFLPTSTSLIIAHIGDSKKGLRAIHLCKPGVIQNNKIRSWEFALPIFEIDSDSASYASPFIKEEPAEEKIPQVPLEKIEKPKVQRKKKAN